MCTRPSRPKWSMVPRPLRPSTPEACASSTIIMAPWRSAASVKPGSAPISPSMENTPSVISSLRPGTASSSLRIFSGAAASLCGNTWILARESRQPSMMLAWFNSSPKSAWFAGITRERLEREGQVALQLPANAAGEVLPFSDASWFRTASGRGELTPVPVFTAPAESRGGTAASTGEYPLEMLARKSDNYMNSTFANIPRHRRMEARGAGVLEMHPADARARAIADGDAVEVFNARGSLRLRARIGDAVPQGVVSARLDWNKLSPQRAKTARRGPRTLGAANGGTNVNVLTSETLTDIGGGGQFYSTPGEG